MKPYYADDAATVHHGDSLEVLRAMPDASVDAVVTDPPYGLEFMGKEWDSFGNGRRGAASNATAGMTGMGHTDGGNRLAQPTFLGGLNPRCTTCGRSQRGGSPCRCDALTFTDERGPRLRAFQAWCQEWATECLRVLKPGGHLLAFGGTRTYHRLACAIEDAGFEIRDSITWMYGSGFPKSLDVSKAIDRRRDDREAILAITSRLADVAEARGIARADVDAHMGTSDMGGWWLSRLQRRCAVPTWEQWRRLRELLGFGEEMDAEVWRLNGRKGAPGDAWGQREVIGEWSSPGRGQRSVEQAFGLTKDSGVITSPATEEATRWRGWGTALKPASEPIVVARKPLAGTVAETVQRHGTGALNIDACRIGSDERVNQAGGSSSLQRVSRVEQGYRDTVTTSIGQASIVTGRWPTNVVFTHAPDCEAACIPGCPVAELDLQSGVLKSGANPTRRGSDKFRDAYGEFAGQIECVPHRGADEGGASRFFPTFRYNAKADAAERPRVNGIAWPTVKPLALMEWLVRLVTPPGGTVLEPFAGSGTTVEAAIRQGFRCIAVERDETALPLIAERIRRASRPWEDPAPGVELHRAGPDLVGAEQPSLFAVADVSSADGSAGVA